MKRILSWFFQNKEEEEVVVKDTPWRLLTMDMCRAGAIWKYLNIRQRLRLRRVSRFWRDVDPEAVPPEQWIPLAAKLRGYHEQWCILHVLQHRLHILCPTLEYKGTHTYYHSYDADLPCHHCKRLMWKNEYFTLQIIPHGHPVDTTEFQWIDRETNKIVLETWDAGDDAFFGKVHDSYLSV